MSRFTGCRVWGMKFVVCRRGCICNSGPFEHIGTFKLCLKNSLPLSIDAPSQC
jgi:hypothetical protein